MKSLAGYLMRGPAQAILVTSVFAVLSLLLPPLSYVSGAAVALVTLRLGPWRGLWVSGGATLGVALLSLALVRNPLPGPAYLMAMWIPLWVLAVSLRRTVSLERTLILAALFGAALIVAFHAGVENPVAFWQKAFEDLMREAGQKPEAVAGMQDAYALMTGAMGAGVTLSLLVSLFLARWWQAQLYHPGGFQREFHSLRFNRVLSLATLVTAAFALLGSGDTAAVAGDLLMVYMVLHLLHGLAVAHHLVKRGGAHPAWLFALYGLLLVALPPTAITIAAVGFADSWFDFRTFFGAKSQEG